MARDREPFMSRWSRLKRAAEQAAEPNPPAGAEAPPPELPPIDSLTPESDFSVFMHRQVDEKLRRAALKKLFSDPAFNVVDGLDDYAEDYTQLESLAEGVGATLEHAKRTLLGRDPEAPQVAEAAQVAEAEQETPGEAGAAPPHDEVARAARETTPEPPPADPAADNGKA
ncbi:MAG: DUF3306 domain-containing protein [Burkholderiales bacterium]|nr:DUF3306 domain-containing protein [Burkholderiales bacterium]